LENNNEKGRKICPNEDECEIDEKYMPKSPNVEFKRNSSRPRPAINKKKRNKKKVNIIRKKSSHHNQKQPIK